MQTNNDNNDDDNYWEGKIPVYGMCTDIYHNREGKMADHLNFVLINRLAISTMHFRNNEKVKYTGSIQTIYNDMLNIIR